MRIQSEDSVPCPGSGLPRHVINFLFCVAMARAVVCSQTLGIACWSWQQHRSERDSATWSKTSKGSEDTFVGPLRFESLASSAQGVLTSSGRRVLRRPVVPVLFPQGEEGTPSYQRSRGDLGPSTTCSSFLDPAIGTPLPFLGLFLGGSAPQTSATSGERNAGKLPPTASPRSRWAMLCPIPSMMSPPGVIGGL